MHLQTDLTGALNNAGLGERAASVWSTPEGIQAVGIGPKVLARECAARVACMALKLLMVPRLEEEHPNMTAVCQAARDALEFPVWADGHGGRGVEEPEETGSSNAANRRALVSAAPVPVPGGADDLVDDVVDAPVPIPGEGQLIWWPRSKGPPPPDTFVLRPAQPAPPPRPLPSPSPPPARLTPRSGGLIASLLRRRSRTRSPSRRPGYCCY